MQVVGGVLGEVERLQARIEHVHLGRRLGLGRELEHDLHAVDHMRLDRLPDDLGRRNERDGAARYDLAEPASTCPRGPLGSMAPNWNMARRIMGVPTSTFSFVTSSMKRSGAMMATLPALTSASSTTPRTPPKWSTWVWRVDHGRHRLPAAMLPVKLQRRPRHLGGDERIDDDDAPAALDDGHVGDVEAAHLVDAVGDLEQAVVHVEPRLPPQAGVHRVRRLLVREEGIVLEREDHPAFRVAEGDVGQRGDEAARGVIEVLGIAERQRVQEGVVMRARDRRGVLAAFVVSRHPRSLLLPTLSLAWGNRGHTAGSR